MMNRDEIKNDGRRIISKTAEKGKNKKREKVMRIRIRQHIE